MALYLDFKNVPGSCFDDDVEISITSEDISMARDIGILTPREVVSSDFVPVEISAPNTSSWASKASGMSPQDAHDTEYLATVRDADFLAFVALIEGDDMDDLVEQHHSDLDGMTNHPYLLLPSELPYASFATEVRVTAIKNGYYVGSLGGQGTNVYIKTPPSQLLELHSLYLMDVTATPAESFPLCATKVFQKLRTADMLVSCLECDLETGILISTPWWDRKETTTRQYLLPTPAEHIGAMIGRQGKNITALIESVNEWNSNHASSGEPEITITPTYDSKGCFVTFHEPPECSWSTRDIEWFISHFHC
jgi:hypothetical protein